MRTLITGHEGLIGSALWHGLPSEHLLVGYERFDLTPEGPFDMIIHTAANCVIRETIAYPALAQENIVVTNMVFDLAKKHNSKLVLFSSGRLSHESFNPYTVSKRYLEDMARAYKDCYNLDSLIIRPETVWGKSKNNERVVMKWIAAARSHQPLIFKGPPNKDLPPIYIKDFTKIVLDLIANFETYKNRTLKVSGQIRKAVDIATSIIEMTKSTSALLPMEGEITQPQYCEPYDFTSPVPFEESLEAFLKRPRAIDITEVIYGS